ncbi:hypothetical protein ONZ45_g15870 [Pleurotus djamor]|nr:hypothetical protein ONZ45_g15870 [Pleurotus djamor]
MEYSFPNVVATRLSKQTGDKESYDAPSTSVKRKSRIGRLSGFRATIRSGGLVGEVGTDCPGNKEVDEGSETGPGPKEGDDTEEGATDADPGVDTEVGKPPVAETERDDTAPLQFI